MPTPDKICLNCGTPYHSKYPFCLCLCDAEALQPIAYKTVSNNVPHGNVDVAIAAHRIDAGDIVQVFIGADGRRYARKWSPM